MFKTLDTPIRYLKGIGPKRAKMLAEADINTIEDLFYYFPRRYEDRTNFTKISGLKEGQAQTIKGTTLALSERRAFSRQKFRIIEIVVGDDTGKIFCVWFNQPYLKQYFKLGQTLILYGKVDYYVGRLQMSSPEFEIVQEDKDESLNIGRIVPIYSLPYGITQRYFRQIVRYALDEYLTKVTDFLPYDIRSRNNLLNLALGFLNIHFPDNFELQKEALRRLSFDEFFLFQVTLLLRKLRKKEKIGFSHKIEGKLLDNFLSSLPFKLTRSQESVLEEIKLDMAARHQMQRLLQGDVGSGKTIVATIAGIIAIQGGYQVAFMVPTEILAKQHYINIKNQISKIKYTEKQITLGLLTSSASKKEKEKIYEGVKEGRIDLVIGTHALLEEDVQFKSLGLVVIDEQHKFGVSQRLLLPRKGIHPDILIMTATPIPRTLAITLYGDLDISVINELPAGRLPVKTLHFTREESFKAYEIARNQLLIGHQVYIVYPVIEESFALDIAGAQKMYTQLKETELKGFRLSLIHGRLKQKEQDELMLKFKNNELDCLVSTTVLEVGIDVSNATCMLIENAQRFGLAQLHQLRGRVGRGSSESFCILISDSSSKEPSPRMEAMLNYNDGFRIAEEDLKIRGPGEFFGQRQHGLSELKVSNPLSQFKLLKRAREEAMSLLKYDPRLENRQSLYLKEKLLKRFPGYDNLVTAA